jgi:hypothetical protein
MLAAGENRTIPKEQTIDLIHAAEATPMTLLSDVPQWCLHRSDGYNFCYAPPAAVLVRVGDRFSTPVCAKHVEAGQAAIRGRTEVQPLHQWLAGDRGYRPGLAGS